MTSEDVEDIKRHMDAAVARIHTEVHEILIRNGFLDRILAWRAQNAARLQSQDALSCSDDDRQSKTRG